ncbi:hypothetical protein Tco_1375885 [Tanacetum coccineum]
MNIQFLVDAKQQNFRSKLVLPNVFTETLYTGIPWLYLIHNRGTKHKVWLQKVTGKNNYTQFSDEWKAFISDSRYMRVNTLHFIRVAPDEYYVTGYHNYGSKCNGYDLAHIGYRQRRCLVMVTNMKESPMPFADSGLGLRFKRVPCMPLDNRALFIRSLIDKDPRMKHECVWDNHEEHHDDEEKCFYAPWLMLLNEVVWPDSKNHMNMMAHWRFILKRCDFDDDKMVRFKFIELVSDARETVNPIDLVMIPPVHLVGTYENVVIFSSFG